MRKILIASLVLLAGIVLPLSAEEIAPTLNGANTVWVMVATALVMFMTMPALGFFYGGLVRKKNILSILMQCLITLALVSFIWMAFGYSLAFSDTELIPGFLGDFKWAFFSGIAPTDLSPYAVSDQTGRIPHLLFALFQCMFAVITPAVVISAFAERIRFSAFILFTIIWEIAIYIPLAHMAWSMHGILAQKGLLDFAGGTVVEINAGFSALAASLVIGRRNNLKALPPHNMPFTALGAGMLWFGWFGFNAGSGLAADGVAVSAFLTTNMAGAAGALTWGILEWCFVKRATILGVASGAIVGLVAITPAAGFVDTTGAIAIGAIGCIAAYPMVAFVKSWLGYDDSLDAFGCHGIAGLVGTILTGVFANPLIWKGTGKSFAGALYGNPGQLGIQCASSLIAVAVSFLGTFVILKFVDMFIGARVDAKSEAMGLDITQHHEHAYTIIE